MVQRMSLAEWLAQQTIPEFSAAPRAAIDATMFRAYGHHAARIVGGKFIEDPDPDGYKNHAIGLVKVLDTTTRVLLHNEIPLLAFAAHHRDDEGYGGYDFVDDPNLARAFGEEFVIAPKLVLERPTDLLAIERAWGKDRDLDYWVPKRIGDIFFNFWD